MVEHQVGHEAQAAGRLKDFVRQTGSLRLVSTQQGSFVAELEVAPPPDMFDYGLDALEDLMGGLENPYVKLPPAVAREVAEIPADIKEGVDSVTFVGGKPKRRIVLGRGTRFEKPRTRPAEVKQVSHVGRVLEVDWNDRTAELHTPTGVVSLAFGADMGDLLHQAARQLVQVTGIGAVDKGGRVQSLLVEAIHETVDDSAFWSAPLTRLINEQGVGPYTFPTEILGPEGETAEEFLAAALS